MYPLPLCETYAAHLNAEHRRLTVLLRSAAASLRTSFASLSTSSGHKQAQQELVRSCEALRGVRHELTQHFAEEEGGGCLDEAVCHRPQLAGELHRLKREHPTLLRDVDCLIAKLASGEPTAAEQAQWMREMEAFVDRVTAHEAAEDKLLDAGFGCVVRDE